MNKVKKYESINNKKKIEVLFFGFLCFFNPFSHSDNNLKCRNYQLKSCRQLVIIWNVLYGGYLIFVTVRCNDFFLLFYIQFVPSPLKYIFKRNSQTIKFKLQIKIRTKSSLQINNFKRKRSNTNKKNYLNFLKKLVQSKFKVSLHNDWLFMT